MARMDNQLGKMKMAMDSEANREEIVPKTEQQEVPGEENAVETLRAQEDRSED
jgi:hypothetical protein